MSYIRVVWCSALVFLACYGCSSGIVGGGRDSGLDDDAAEAVVTEDSDLVVGDDSDGAEQPVESAEEDSNWEEGAEGTDEGDNGLPDGEDSDSEPALPEVPLFGVFEIELQAKGPYGNPYLELSGTASFQGPSAETILIDGFWDGGSTLRIRMAPTSVGLWSYSVSSSDPDLDGKTGGFRAVTSSDPGFVERDPANPWGWRTSAGPAPHFWMSDTCWRVFQMLTIAQFQEYIDARSSQGFNHVRGHFNSMDAGVSNEGGSPFDNADWDRINPAYWKGVDARLAYANAHGITMDLTVGSGSRWPAVTAAQRERYLRYLIARYAAYHISWEGLAEYEEGSGATTLINAIGGLIKDRDPYHHPRSTHTLDSNAELASSGWLDWIMYQTRGPNPSTLIADRKLEKPLVNEEYYYEQTCSGSSAHDGSPDQLRSGAWQIVVSGGYLATGNTATYTGGSNSYDSCGLDGTGVSQMRHLYDFWTKNGIRYWEMSPQNALATNGARCLAKSDHTYVCLKQQGGSFELDLGAATGTFLVQRFNPRDGSFASLPDVNGGSLSTFAMPDANEWVFLVKRRA